ncbi:hypothetical protein CNEO_100033 [Clostridium neonatale]|nr:hypothetical protein CNEO_100033 [Clostridium neonatale]CAI3633401.1 hypothetical protein CNEO3_300048 [Clostridium neonatale]
MLLYRFHGIIKAKIDKEPSKYRRAFGIVSIDMNMESSSFFITRRNKK